VTGEDKKTEAPNSMLCDSTKRSTHHDLYLGHVSFDLHATKKLDTYCALNANTLTLVSNEVI